MKKAKDPFEDRRYEDEKRREAFKRAAPIADPVPYVATFTTSLKLKPALTRFGKRKAVV